ncbi:MAG: hypothetical protein V3V67_18325 [Myxococcota bacterium]
MRTALAAFAGVALLGIAPGAFAQGAIEPEEAQEEAAARRVGIEEITALRAEALRDLGAAHLAQGERGDDRKLLAGKIVLRAMLTDDLELLLNYDQAKQHQNNRGRECVYNDQTPEHLGLVPSLTPLMNLFFDFQNICNQSRAGDKHDYATDVNGENDLDSWGLNATLTWDVTENLTLKSITGWRRQNNVRHQGYDSTTVKFGDCYTDKEEADALSTEFQVIGTSMDGRLNWTGGVFAFREHTNPRRGIYCYVSPGLTTPFTDIFVPPEFGPGLGPDTSRMSSTTWATSSST